ncbi:MAG: zf-HC2 domain-containing protein [Pseudonocardiaceae bacterium]
MGAGKPRGGRERPTVRLGGGWQLPESHLLPDAVVAFVDGELTPGPHERAAMHVAHCPSCAGDVTAQRQVRAAVHESLSPAVPAGLLASLRSIPQNTELPTTPDNLAVTEDGQLVAVQRPDRFTLGMPLGSAAPLGSAPLGSAAPLGTSGLLGSNNRRQSRRAAQGAGVVVSGLVLSALALVVAQEDVGEPPVSPEARNGAVNNDVLRADFTGGPQIGGPQIVKPPAPDNPLAPNDPRGTASVGSPAQR